MPAAAPAEPSPIARDPHGEELRQARLVPAACHDEPKAVEADIKRMRAEVDAQFKVWHDAQPECWHDMWLAQHPCGADPCFGMLGLTGVGEGGGGFGEGIGLGGVGSIGHAFGSGHGRLGGSALIRYGMTDIARASVYSKTNDQIAGVDEADIVKTDGRYVYLAAGGALRIVEALHPRVLSATKVAGVARELFVDGDRAVMYSSSTKPARPCRYGYDCQFAGDGTRTLITVLDVADRARPRVVRTIELSGSLIASRRIGNAVHTVVADGDARRPLYATWPADLSTCGTDEKFVRAKFAALERENEGEIRAAMHTLPQLTDRGVARSLCPGVLRTALGDGQAYTSIVSFDATADDAPPTTATIKSRPGAVFASGDALYLSVVSRRQGQRSWYSFYQEAPEVSEVHKFRIGGDPRQTRYLGSGVVPGHVLNQFAMDEWGGRLRIATSIGRVPDPAVTSAVSILGEDAAFNLVRVGAIEGLAPREDIRAVRFDGDRGYVVAFKKTDPLFVLDLATPAHPRVLGELKIPGFSTYLHRLDDGHLLSIGFDANDHGSYAYFDGLLLQLFDVSDPASPKLLHREKIGTRGSSSEAAADHLAFNYLPERGLLAVPMTICEGGGDGVNGRRASFSGLLVYRVDLADGFLRLGGIDRGGRGASCDAWWSNASSVVKRSLFLDDLVYAIGDDRVQVQRLGHFGVDLADLALAP